MANQMFDLTTKPKPSDYLLAYKYSQDHLELLFSCIRSREGCSTKLFAIEVCSTENGNCVNFTGWSDIIPIIHTKKNQKKTFEKQNKNINGSSNVSQEKEIGLMYDHLHACLEVKSSSRKE